MDTDTALTTGEGRVANVATQSICPLDLDEHLLVGTVDAVTYALAMDALTHDGAANPARISRSVCLQPYMPGVTATDVRDNLHFVPGLPHVLLVPFPYANLADAPQFRSEPALKCYVFAQGC